MMVRKKFSVNFFRTIIFYWKLIMHLRSTSLRLNFRDRMGPTPRLFTVRKSKMPESGIDPATVRKSTAYSVTLLESLVATPLFKALTLVN